MALLDMAFHAQVKCIAVHVNYHKRASAARDSAIVSAYCRNADIPCFVFDAPEGTGNFQDFARRFRYEKFAQVAQKHQAQGVLVAHHRDDDAETYLMQKMRNSQVTHYGLSASAYLFEIRVDRPLLQVPKAQLIDYCTRNKISYGIDETNISDDYLRNRIRKELSEPAISDLLIEKQEKNRQLQEFRQANLELLEKTSVSMETFQELAYPYSFLQNWIRIHVPLKALSEDHLEELYRQIRTSFTLKHDLGPWRIIKQYGQISVLPEPKSYTYSLREASDLQTPFFEILTQADDQHAFDVCDADFPLTIRSALPKETYLVGNKVHKLSRWFISHKIPQGQRETWPVVLNHAGEVIHIFRIRIHRHINTHKTRLYMLK